MPLIAEGEWHGEILGAPRGTGGFGYDPLFFDPDSVESVVAGVRQLEDAEEWKRRSAASVAWAKRYNWPDAAKQLLAVLTSAAESRASSRGR